MIQGYYDDQHRPRLEAQVSMERDGPSARAEFILSTGTPRTLLPAETALRLGWQQPEEPAEDFRMSAMMVRGWLAIIHLVPDGPPGLHLHSALEAAIVPEDHWPADHPPVAGMDLLQAFRTTFSPSKGTVELHPNLCRDQQPGND